LERRVHLEHRVLLSPGDIQDDHGDPYSVQQEEKFSHLFETPL